MQQHGFVQRTKAMNRTGLHICRNKSHQIHRQALTNISSSLENCSCSDGLASTTASCVLVVVSTQLLTFSQNTRQINHMSKNKIVTDKTKKKPSKNNLNRPKRKPRTSSLSCPPRPFPRLMSSYLYPPSLFPKIVWFCLCYEERIASPLPCHLHDSLPTEL